MNKLMERLALLGFSPEEAFPFSKVSEISQEKILEGLARVLNEETLGVAAKILDAKGYDYYLKAIEVAEKRFLFYKNLLESEESRNKHLAKLGNEDLTLRIVFAMYGCIEHSKKVLCYIDNVVENIILDSSSAMEIGYNRWLLINLKDPITTCRMVGLCICEEGNKEPYINSCVISDPTRILISRAEQQRRREESYKLFKEVIKKK